MVFDRLAREEGPITIPDDDLGGGGGDPIQETQGHFSLFSFTNYTQTIEVDSTGPRTLDFTLVFDTNMPLSEVFAAAYRDNSVVTPSPLSSPSVTWVQLPYTDRTRWTYKYTRTYEASTGSSTHNDKVAIRVTFNTDGFIYLAHNQVWFEEHYQVTYLPPPPGYFHFESWTDHGTLSVSDMSTLTVPHSLVFETNMPFTITIAAFRDGSAVDDPFANATEENPTTAEEIPAGSRYRYHWTRVYAANIATAYGHYRRSHTDKVSVTIQLNTSGFSYSGTTSYTANEEYTVNYTQWRPYLPTNEHIWTSTWPLRLGPMWQSWAQTGGQGGHGRWDGNLGSHGNFYYYERYVARLTSDAPNGSGLENLGIYIYSNNNPNWPGEPGAEGGINQGYVGGYHGIEKRYVWPDGQSSDLQHDSVTIAFGNNYGTVYQQRSQQITVFTDTGLPTITCVPSGSTSSTVDIGQGATYTMTVTGKDAMYVGSISASIIQGSGASLTQTSSTSEASYSTNGQSDGEHRRIRVYTLTVPASSSAGQVSHKVSFTATDNVGDTATTTQTFTTTYADISAPTVSAQSVTPSTVTMPRNGSATVSVAISASDNVTASNQLKAFVGAYYNGTLIGSNPLTQGELVLPQLGLTKQLLISNFGAPGVPYRDNTVVITSVVEDEAGNRTTTSTNITVHFDHPMTGSLTLYSGNSSTVEMPPGTASAFRTFQISANDGDGISSLVVKQDGVTRYTHNTSSNPTSVNTTQTFTFYRSDFAIQNAAHSVPFSMEVEDVNGNTLTFNLEGGLTVYTVPDTQEPTGTLTASYNGSTIGNGSTFNMTNISNANIAYSVTASDNDSVSKITVLDSITISDYTEAADHTTASFTRALTRGPEPSTSTLTTKVELEDPTGNKKELQHQMSVVVTDITGPSVTVGRITDGGTIAGDKLSTSIYLFSGQSQEVTFYVEATDASSIHNITLTGNNSSDSDGSLLFWWGGTAYRTFKRTYFFSEGSRTDTLTATITDNSPAKNTTTIQFTVTVVADNLPSMFVYTVNPTSVSLVNSTPVNVTFRVAAADDYGLDKIEILKNSSSYSSGTATVVATYNANGANSADQNLTYAYIRGQNGYNVGTSGSDYYWARVTDTQGQTRTTTSAGTRVTYNVPDSQAPTATLEITDPTGEIDISNVSSVTITYKITATDDVAPTDFEFGTGSADPGSIQVLSGSTWGRTFTRTVLRSSYNEPSTNTLTTSIRVRDAAGNWSGYVSKAVTIERRDITPPTHVSSAVITELSSDAVAVAENHVFVLNAASPSITLYFVVQFTDNHGVSNVGSNSHLYKSNGDYVHGIGAWDFAGSIAAGPNQPGGNVYRRYFSRDDWFFTMNNDYTLRLSAAANDHSGNSSGYVGQFDIKFSIRDDAGPSVSVDSVSPTSMLLGGTIGAQGVSISVTATDDVVALTNGAVTLTRKLGGTTTSVTSYSRSGNTWTFTDSIPANASAGSYVYTATASDSSQYSTDQTDTATLTVVRDDAAPADLALTHNAAADRKIYLYSTTASQAVTVTATSSSLDVARFNFSSEDPAHSSSDTTSPYQYSKTFSADSFSEGTTTSTITAYAVDNVGNQSGSVSLDFTIIKDLTAPSVANLQHGFGSLAYLTPNITSRQANITFNASDAITSISSSDISITATLDGADFTSKMGFAFVSKSGSTFTYSATINKPDFTNNVNKTVTITASATDRSGRVGSQSVTLNVLRDDDAPNITALTASPSSFVFNSHNSSTRDVTFTVRAEDGGSGLASVIFDSTPGTFTDGTATFTRTLTASSFLADKTNQTRSYNVAVIDLAGNSRSSSVSISVDRDETLPTASVSVEPTSIIFTESGQSQVVTVNVTADGTGTSVQGVGLSPSAGWLAYGLVNGAYKFTRTIYADDYANNDPVTAQWHVIVSDMAGNQRTYHDAVSVSIVKDTIHPVVSLTSDKYVVNFTGVDQSDVLNLTLTASDAAGISTRTVTGATPVVGYIDRFTMAINGNDSRWNYEGASHKLTINGSATDLYGNSTPSSIEITINQLDVTVPKLTLALETLSGSSAGSATTLSEANQTSSINARMTASDNVALKAAPTLTANDDRVTVGTVTPDGSGEWQAQITFSESQYSGPGLYQFRLTARVLDTSDNLTEEHVDYGVQVSDYTKPVIHTDTVSIVPNPAHLAGGKDVTVTISVEVSDNVSGLPDPTLGGSNPASSTVVSATRKRYTYYKVIAFSDYAEGFSGTEDFTLSVTDGGSNTAQTVISVPVTKADETAPTFDISATATALTFEGENAADQNVVFEAVNIVEAVGVGKITVNGVEKTEEPWRVSIPFSPGSVDITVDQPQNNTVTVKLEDTSGNSTTKTANVAITTRDATPPTLTVTPQDSAGNSKTTVTLNSTTQSDEVIFKMMGSDNSQSIEFIPPDDMVVVPSILPKVKKVFSASDPAFPIGQTTLYTPRFYARDPTGNQTYVDVQITVIHQDDVAPIASLSLSTSEFFFNAPGQSGTVVATAIIDDAVDPDGTASITGGFSLVSSTVTGLRKTVVWSKTLSSNDFTSYHRQTYPVQLTVTDKAGNSASDDASYIVNMDTEAPTLDRIEVYVDGALATPTFKESDSELTYVDVLAKVYTDDNSGTTPYITISGFTYVGNAQPWHFEGRIFRNEVSVVGNTSISRTLTIRDAVGVGRDDGSNQLQTTYDFPVILQDDINPVIQELVVTDDSVVLSSSNPSQTVVFSIKATDTASIPTFTVEGLTEVSGESQYLAGGKDFTKTYNNTNTVAYPYNDQKTETFTFTATDGAGNTAQQGKSITILNTDSEAPAITKFQANTYAVALNGNTPTATVTITVAATDNIGVSSYSMPSEWGIPTIVGGERQYQRTFRASDISLWPLGQTTPYVVALEVSDAAGNKASDTLTLNITNSDTTAPIVSAPTITPASIVLGTGDSQSVTVQVTASDSQTGIDPSSITLNGADLPSATLSVSGGTITYTMTWTFDHLSGKALGTHSYEGIGISVRDGAGNQTVSSTGTLSVTKRDITDPVIQNLTVINANGDVLTDVLVTDENPVYPVYFVGNVTDNYGVSTVTAKDQHNNVLNPAVQQFTGYNYSFGPYNIDYANFGSETQSVDASVIYRMYATDLAGNTHDASVTLGVTKTNTAPRFANNQISISESSIQLTNDSQSATVTVTAIVSDYSTLNVWCMIVESGEPINVKTSSNGTFTFEKTYTYGTEQFNYVNENPVARVETFRVTAEDGALTSYKEVSVSVTKIDSEAPQLSIVASPEGTVQLSSGVTSVTKTFTVACYDNDALAAGYPHLNIGGDRVTYIGQSGNTFTWQKVYHTDDYPHYRDYSETVSVYARDKAGNTMQQNISVMTTKTDTAAPASAAGITDDVNGTVTVTTDAQSRTVNFQLIATDVSSDASVGEIIKSVAYNAFASVFQGQPWWGNEALARTYATNNVAQLYSSVAPYGLLYAYGFSYSPNGTVHCIKANYDRTPPRLETVSLPEQLAYTYALRPGLTPKSLSISSGSTPSLSIASDNVTYTYSWSESYSYGNYNYGNTPISLTSTLTDGNLNTQSFSWNGVLAKSDTQKPVISNLTVTPATLVLTKQNPTGTVNVSMTVTDNRAVSQVSVSPDGHSTQLVSQGSSGSTYQFSQTFNFDDYSPWPASLTIENEATTTLNFIASASDAALNLATAKSFSVVVKVQDNVSPTITSFTVEPTSFALRDGENQVVTALLKGSDDIHIYQALVSGFSYTGFANGGWNFSKTIYWADLAAYGSNTIDVTSSLSDYASNMAFQTIQIQANKKDSVAPLISSFQAGYSAYSLDSGTNMPDEYQIQLTAEYSDNLNSIASVEIDGGFAFTNSEKTIMRKTISNDLYPWGDTFETYTLTVTDTDGNQATESITVRIYKYDSTDPTITNPVLSPDTASLSASNTTDTITFTCNIADNKDIQQVGLPGFTLVSTSGTQYTFQRTFAYADYVGTSQLSQTHTATLTVRDSAGNDATYDVVTKIEIQDVTLPGIASFSATGATVTTSSPNATGSVTATITDDWPISSASLERNGTSIGSLVVDGSTYTWTIQYAYADYSNFGSNTETYTIRALDANGNVKTQNVTATITKSDDENPTIHSFTASPSSVTLTSANPSQSVTISAEVSDNVALSDYPTLTLTGSSTQTKTDLGSERFRYTWTKTYAIQSFSFGTSSETATLTHTDVYGNQATDSLTIQVNKPDQTAPVMGNVYAETSPVFISGSDTSVDAYVYLTVTDNAGASVISFDGTIGAVYDSVKTAAVGVPDRYYFKTTFDANYPAGASNRSIVIKASDGTNASLASFSLAVRKVQTAGVPIVHYIQSNATSVTLSGLQLTATVTYDVDVISDGITTLRLGSALQAQPISSPSAAEQNTGGGVYRFSVVYAYHDYAAGSNTVDNTVTATGSNGTGSLASSITVLKNEDSLSPVISSFTADQTALAFRRGDAEITVNFTALVSDNVQVQSVSGTGLTAVTPQTGTTYAFTKAFGFDYTKAGTIVDETISITATDTVGNSVTASVVIEVHYIDFREISIAANQQVIVEADLNASIISSGGFLGFAGGRLNSTNTSAVFSLPSGSATFSCGDITGIGPDGQSVGVINGLVTVSTSGNGTISAEVTLAGGPLIAEVNNDVNLTQVVSWVQEPQLVVTSTTADQLSDEFTTIDAATYYADIIQSIEALYQGSSIAAWTFEVGRIEPAQTSAIHEYAVHKDRIGNGTAIFEEGEHIVLQTAHRYSLSVSDINGAEVIIINPTDIYAVLKQNSAAPPLAPLPGILMFPGGWRPE